ncbi:MAG TPA: hypothetical protein VE863_00345 [Pyrinomonadaceae bacterium]|jgi:hypothetical protein|nr:hypothetical protein [Pyrinomonadaceae bacterium]
MRKFFFVGLLISIVVGTVVLAGPSGYHVDKTYKIGGGAVGIT